MSQQWIGRELQEHEAAIKRHQRYVTTHETIIRVLRAYEQQTITAAQAIAQLEEAAASQVELGLAGLFRQTIERLRAPHPLYCPVTRDQRDGAAAAHLSSTSFLRCAGSRIASVW